MGDLDAGERPPLSRERIVAAAIAFVDRRGLTALTMRRLGTELGVEAMSLYRYVEGRDDLLEGMVEQMIGRLHLGAGDGRPKPDDGWQAYLQWLAHGVRTLAREHPQVFPLIATRHPAAPWLRPPLRSLRVVEDFLRTLVSRGFSDESALVPAMPFVVACRPLTLVVVAWKPNGTDRRIFVSSAAALRNQAGSNRPVG